MKHFLVLSFAIFIGHLTFSQTTITIDKDESNSDIFDVKDPFSLMGLIMNNQINLPVMHCVGITESDLAYIRKKGGGSTFEYMIGPQSDLPWVTQYGDDSLQELPDGTFQYVYPAPDRLYYDVIDISRIILTKDTVTNPVTGESYFGISTISFAKAYTKKKYITTLTINFQDLIKLDAFKAHIRIPRNIQTQLLDNLYRNVGNTIQSKIESRDFPLRTYDDFGLTFFPDAYANYFSRSDRESNLHQQMHNQGYLEDQDTWYLYLSEEQWKSQTPFTYIEYQSTANDSSFALLFDESIFTTHESDYPVVDQWGNDSTFVDTDGLLYYIYPKPDFLYYWIYDADLEVRAQLDFLCQDSEVGFGNSIKVEKLIFTKVIDGYSEPIVVASINLYKAQKLLESQYREAFEAFNPYYDLHKFNQLPCFRKLMEYVD
ncbi:MAG: hypothetical protein QNK23_15860 [Crocinitomicaceae bacterium]|nr:hypothetical protein [Crocinitomicaceae bacterium]